MCASFADRNVRKVLTPVEFGHKVFLAESAQGLVTQYEVLQGNPGDDQQVEPSLKRHKENFDSWRPRRVHNGFFLFCGDLLGPLIWPLLTLYWKLPPLPERNPAMLSFEPDAVRLRKFREKLQAMTDQELIDFGRRLARIPKRVSGVPDAFNQLTEARAEWRRRYPRPDNLPS